MKIIILILLFLFTSKHLIDSWNDDSAKRKQTKPFLLLFIIAYYLLSSKNTNIFLILALVTSWLGDVLLIPKGNQWFTAGGISFMFSHFFFILVYLGRIDFSKIPWLFIIIVALIYYGIALKIIMMVKDTTPKMMVPPMYFYLICNSTMNVFALMQYLSNRNTGSLVALIGAILFYISDCTLFLVRYYKNPNIVFKKHFTVMLTYVVGEFLITLGILLMNG